MSLGALGRRAGRSEFPKKAGEEAAPSGANSDLCGGQTWRGGRRRVPAHTEAKQRSVPAAFCSHVPICTTEKEKCVASVSTFSFCSFNLIFLSVDFSRDFCFRTALKRTFTKKRLKVQNKCKFYIKSVNNRNELSNI